MTLSTMYRLARAVAGRRGQAVVTIATDADGDRYGAWPYGCALVPSSVWDGLGRPDDGTWIVRPDTSLQEHQPLTGFTPDTVREQMLPLLDSADRTPLSNTVWLYDQPRSGMGLVRLLERGDGGMASAHEDFLAAWQTAFPGLMWQVGGVNGPIVWANRPGTRAKALLLPVLDRRIPAPPAHWRPSSAAGAGCTS